MIVSKFIQSKQLLLRHPSNFKRARICKPAMAFVTDIHIDRRFTVGRENGGSISVHIFEDTAMADHTSER